MVSARWVWPALIVLLAAGAVALTGWDVGWPLRPLVVFVFLLVGPGLALARLLPIDDTWSLWAIALASSFALDTLASTALLYLGIWSPSPMLWLIAALALLGAAAQVVVAAPAGARGVATNDVNGQQSQ